ncbi:MAG: hypothetical protein A2Z34_06835 [Planctomycetes bacterium RBG_16_59_8]|nr:MAG: hypothetical protein A2Z34_06835 [Planctomycetes bacterium RBG_16_59_8]
MSAEEQRGRNPWGIVWVVCAAVIAVIFGGYELIERTILRGTDPNVLHYLHILRGVTCTIVVACVVTWRLLKLHLPRFHMILPLPSLSPAMVKSERFMPNIEAVQWLIVLRWIAFVILCAILVIGVYVMDMVNEEQCRLPLTVCALLVGISNILYFAFSRSAVEPRKQIIVQMISDLILLSCLIHYSGGIENVLFFVYVFHVILASILLSRADAFFISALTSFLFSFVAVMELSRVLPHNTLKIFPHEKMAGHLAHAPTYVLTLCAISGIIVFVIAYLTSSVAERLRGEMKKEKETFIRVFQANKMTAIGELAGNVAHEINNPIGIIMLKIKNLLADEREQLPPKIVGSLEKMDHHAQRVATIVKGLLDFARPSVERKDYIDLRDVVEESLVLTGMAITGGKIALEKEFTRPLPKIMGNFREIQQVVINFINNAVDAMPDGGTLTIRLQSDSFRKENGAIFGVRIDVGDTGVGVPPEYIPHLFTPFFTTKGKKGTGLGLAICQGLVKSHGGEIWAESAVGEGAIFHVFLPSADVFESATGGKQ